MSTSCVNYYNGLVENLEMDDHPEYIKNKVLSDESQNITEIIELQERCSTSIVIESSFSDEPLFKNIVINEGYESHNELIISDSENQKVISTCPSDAESSNHKLLFQCFHCSFQRKDLSHIMEHYIVHTLTRFSKEYEIGYECSSTKIKDKQKIYHCFVCSIKFGNLYNLFQHLGKYHTEPPFMCVECNSLFKCKSLLHNHFLTHIESFPNKCLLHSFKCKKEKFLQNYLKYVHSKCKPFKCKKRSFSCKRAGNLLKHEPKHITGKPFHCNHCSFKTKCASYLKAHMLGHNKFKSFHCSVCEYSCATKFLLKDHFINYHTHEKPFPCLICSYSFKRSSSLKRHMQIHDGNKPYECNFCEYSSNRKDNLQIHINVTHSEVKPYSCKFCHFSCKLRSSLKSHMDLHSLLNLYVCEKCSYRFNSEEKLKQHILAHVMNKGNIPSQLINLKSKDSITPVNSISSKSSISSRIICDFEFKPILKHKCPVCEEFFSSKSDLKHHLGCKHADYKPFECEQCGRSFKIKVHLKQHQVVHSDAKPFKCSHCDYSSKLAETLKRHLVTHSQDRPFHCPFCNYKAKLKEKLKRHLITHSAERPFQCSFCSYSSKTKELLKKHSIVHTREKLFNSMSS